MGFQLWCLIIVLILGCTVRGQQPPNVVAKGRMITSEGNKCYPGAWYRHDAKKIIAIERGPTQVHISQEGTWISTKDSNTKKITCTKDSDITYDAYRNIILNTRKNFPIGNVDFIKPEIGPHTASLTTFPIQRGLTTTVSWIKPKPNSRFNITWAGLDWITSKQRGITRVWWNSADPDAVPDAEVLKRWQCDDKLAANYKEPTAKCTDFFDQPEGKYNMKDKPFSGNGTRFQAVASKPKDLFSVPMEMHNDPKKELFALIIGDTTKVNDTRSFVIGFWSNATGTFLLAPGATCAWQTDFTYSDAVAGFSTPQMAWIGKAKLQKWTPKFAEGEVVNLYEGSYNFGTGVPMMSLVDTEGYYRGQVLMGDFSVPPGMFFMDKLEKKSPKSTVFIPSDDCKGYQGFIGKDNGPSTSDGVKLADTVKLYCISLLLVQSVWWF